MSTAYNLTSHDAEKEEIRVRVVKEWATAQAAQIIAQVSRREVKAAREVVAAVVAQCLEKLGIVEKAVPTAKAKAKAEPKEPVAGKKEAFVRKAVPPIDAAKEKQKRLEEGQLDQETAGKEAESSGPSQLEVDSDQKQAEKAQKERQEKSDSSVQCDKAAVPGDNQAAVQRTSRAERGKREAGEGAKGSRPSEAPPGGVPAPRHRAKVPQALQAPQASQAPGEKSQPSMTSSTTMTAESTARAAAAYLPSPVLPTPPYPIWRPPTQAFMGSWLERPYCPAASRSRPPSQKDADVAERSRLSPRARKRGLGVYDRLPFKVRMSSRPKSLPPLPSGAASCPAPVPPPPPPEKLNAWRVSLADSVLRFARAA